MSEAVRDLMNVIFKGIVQDEGSARELANTAQQLGDDQELLTGEAMRALSRWHRVRAIKGRAELAELAERYVRCVNESIVPGGRWQ